MSFLKNKFDDIPCDGRIETEKFLACCDEIVKFFDDMGTVFKPVRSDIENNIRKIRTRFSQNRSKCGTLPEIIDMELAETDKKYKIGKQGIATDALVWLHRGLKYIHFFFLHLLSEDYVTPEYPDRNLLHNCAKLAYEDSLKRYHNVLIKGVFTMAMKAAPYRDKFIKKIAGNQDKECDKEREEKDEKDTLDAIKDFNVNFDKTIKNIGALLDEKKVIKDE